MDNGFISENKLIHVDANHAHLLFVRQLTSSEMICVSLTPASLQLNLAPLPRLIGRNQAGKGKEKTFRGIGMYLASFFPLFKCFCQILSAFLSLSWSLSLNLSACLYIFISLHLSQFLCASVVVTVGWMMLISLLLVSLHCYRSTSRFSFTSLLLQCALPHSELFDVNGNSWLREIWWKVSRPVFTPGQMVLNKLGEKAQIHCS